VAVNVGDPEGGGGGGFYDDVLEPPSRGRGTTRGGGPTGSAMDTYTERLAAYPCSCAASGIFALSLLALLVLLMPAQVGSHVNMASEGRIGRLVVLEAAVASVEVGTPLYKTFDLFLAYELKDRSNPQGLLGMDALLDIRDFERRLRDLPEWRALCNRTEPGYRRLCELGVSLANYAVPAMSMTTSDVVPSSLTFNGNGQVIAPIGGVLRVVDRHNLTGLLLPAGYAAQVEEVVADAELPPVAAVRSAFRFKLYCCNSSDTVEAQQLGSEGLLRDWRAFLEDAVVPLILEPGPDPEYPDAWPLQVYATGRGVEEVETRTRLLEGLPVVTAGSITFFCVYMVLHLRSVTLGLAGALAIALSLPFPYLAVVVLGSAEELHVFTSLALFFVLGLGAEMVFFYSSVWSASARYSKDEAERLGHTCWVGGKASLGAASTVALTFSAAFTSPLAPLRELGAFVGLFAFSAWATVTGIYVPLLLVDERYCFAFLCVRFDNATRNLLKNWRSTSHVWAKPVLACWLITAVAVIVLTLPFIDIDSRELGDLSRGHSEIMGKFAAPSIVFTDAMAPPGLVEEVCPEHQVAASEASPTSIEAPGGGGRCGIFWCEVEDGNALGTDGYCECTRREQPWCSAQQAEAVVVRRYVGTSRQFAEASMAADLAEMAAGHGFSVPEGVDVLSSHSLEPVVMHEWTSGQVVVEPTTDVWATGLRRERPDTSCGWWETCFCGSYACPRAPGWQSSSAVRVQTPEAKEAGEGAEDGSAKDEATSQVASDVADDPGGGGSAADAEEWRRRGFATVNVALGLQISSSDGSESWFGSLWNFRPWFDPTELWSQRDVLSLCIGLPEELQVIGGTCWVEEFRTWLRGQGQRYPVPEERFNALVAEYISNRTRGWDHLWIRDGKVKAWYQTHYVNTSAIGDRFAYKQKWDAYISKWNGQAKVNVAGALSLSELWAEATEQGETSSSRVALTLFLAVLFAMLGAWGVSWFDSRVTLGVGAALLGVVGSLLFIIVAADWAFGATELIGLIACVAYASTFALRAAHEHRAAYECATAARAALSGPERSVPSSELPNCGAGPLLGATATAAGGALFFLGSPVAFHGRLGVILLAGVLLSALAALGPVHGLLSLPLCSCLGSIPEMTPRGA